MQVEWSLQAQKDLADTLRYIVDEFGLKKAVQVNAQVLDTTDSLSRFPLLGRKIFTDRETGVEYRSLSMKYSRVIYIIEGDILKIILVWNNRRDLKQLRLILTSNVIE